MSLVSDGPTTTLVRHCMFCDTVWNFEVDYESFVNYLKGMTVQKAFPTATADEREAVMTGSHGACFDKAFPDD